MSLLNKSVRQKHYSSLSEQELQLVKAYIRGAVHSFVNTSPNNSFAVRTLFGDNNRNWDECELRPIYYYYNKKYSAKGLKGSILHEKAHKQAANDVGRILLNVLQEDTQKEYIFTGTTNQTNWYKLKS